MIIEPDAEVADHQRERRLGRYAGVAAMVSVLALFAALIVAGNAAPAPATPQLARGPDSQIALAKQLHQFHDAEALQTLALGLKALAFALVVPVVLFLAGAIRRRRPTTASLPLLGTVGAILIIASSAAGFFALSDVADTFVRGGMQTSERARHLAASSGFLRVSALAEILSRVVFAVWLGWASYAAMQSGLLTRFLGVFGIGAAVAWAFLIPSGETFFVGWLASVGLLALGWWPGGRPEGWDIQPVQSARAPGPSGAERP